MLLEYRPTDLSAEAHAELFFPGDQFPTAPCAINRSRSVSQRQIGHEAEDTLSASTSPNTPSSPGFYPLRLCLLLVLKTTGPAVAHDCSDLHTSSGTGPVRGIDACNHLRTPFILIQPRIIDQRLPYGTLSTGSCKLNLNFGCALSFNKSCFSLLLK